MEWCLVKKAQGQLYLYLLSNFVAVQAMLNASKTHSANETSCQVLGQVARLRSPQLVAGQEEANPVEVGGGEVSPLSLWRRLDGIILPQYKAGRSYHCDSVRCQCNINCKYEDIITESLKMFLRYNRTARLTSPPKVCSIYL
jgi:hypothetical protein